MNNKQKIVGKNIEYHRIKLGLTQKELAEKMRQEGIKISGKRMAAMEKGTAKVMVDDIFALLYILNITPLDILDGTEDISKLKKD